MNRLHPVYRRSWLAGAIGGETTEWSRCVKANQAGQAKNPSVLYFD